MVRGLLRTARTALLMVLGAHMGWVSACSDESFQSAGAPPEDASVAESSTPTSDAGPTDAIAPDVVVCPPDTNFAFDGENCGRCARRCGVRSQCVEGSCTVAEIRELDGPVGLWISDTAIFATAYDSGGVYRFDKQTLDGDRIVAQAGSWDLVGTPNAIYWTNWNDALGGGGLWQLELGNDAGAKRIFEAASPRWLVRDGEGFYYVSEYQRGVAGVLSTAPSSPYAIAPSGSNDFVSLTVDTNYAYWAVPQEGAIRAAPKRGNGSVRTVRDDAGAPSSVLVDGPDLYFASWSQPSDSSCTGGSITRAKLEGDAGISDLAVLSSTEQCPAALHVDATHVYWTELMNGGAIKRQAKSGGAIETLVPGRSRPSLVRVDSGFLYFFEAGTRTLSRVALP